MNIMYRLTKLWFAFSDMLAWLLLALSIVATAIFPFVGPVYARMTRQPMTTLNIVGTCALWLMVAVGAYAITRRKVLGLVLVLVPAAVSAVSGRMAFALAFAAACIVVFATPFLLAFLRFCPVATSKPTV